MTHPVDQVSEIREGYRGLLVDATKQKSPLLEEEALFGALEKYGPDAITNLAMSIVLRVFTYKDEGKIEDPNIKHLVIAVAILDDLDVLGMEVRHKDNGPT